MGRKDKRRKLEAAARAYMSSPVHDDPAERMPVATARVAWLPPLLIAVVTLVVFLPTLGNEFVSWDDGENLVANWQYRGLAWNQLRWMWTTVHMGHYLPLTWMTFGLDYLLWGMNPLGYHLTNLVLHSANAVVLYCVARRILALALPRAAAGHALAISAGFAAVLFAIHPLRVESVAWATERRDVLSGLFYLLTVLAYLRAREGPEDRRRSYWLSVALFGCAVLSKSIVVSLPVVLVILDVYPLRRLGGSVKWFSAEARRVYAEKIPFVVLSAGASVVAFRALSGLQNAVTLADLDVPSRLAVAAYGLSFYLWKTVVPLQLSPLYELPARVDPWAMPYLVCYTLVAGISAVAVAARRRCPGLLAAWLAFVVTLLPVLGFFQNGPQIAADRYTYLAGLASCVLVGGFLASTLRDTGQRTRWFVGATAVAATLGILTWQQVGVWRDSLTLWSHAVALNRESSFAQARLGDVLAAQGRYAEAVEHTRRAVLVRPSDAVAHANLGALLLQVGQPAEGIEELRRALSLKPGLASAEYNWGLALEREGKASEAVARFRRALQIDPDFAEAHTSLALTLARETRMTAEIGHVLPEVIQRAGVGARRTELVMALSRVQGDKLAEAVEHLRQAVRLRPHDPDAKMNLGAALLQQGNPAEAMECFEQAIRLRPDFVAARKNLEVARALQERKRRSPSEIRRVKRPTFSRRA
jgi:protein O-mannosyl-transferase